MVAKVSKAVTFLTRTLSRTYLHRAYSSGLFGRKVLSSANGFRVATQETIREAQKIVSKIVLSTDANDTVDLFDELSNVLCCTADLAECVRLLHPKKDYVEQAQNCCIEIANYVEKLNTNPELYDSLKKVIHSDAYSSLDKDTKRNVASLLHDFEISGIHLSNGERERVVTLNKTILSQSHAFMHGCNAPALVQQAQLSSHFSDYFHKDGDCLIIDHVPYTTYDESTRELSYRIYHSAGTPQAQLLCDLLSSRLELASLVGYESFAHRTLRNSMAGSPELVMEFLNTLNDKLLPLVEEERREALKFESHSNDRLMPWNVLWLSQTAKQHYLPQSIDATMSDYFPLTSCMRGLDNLLSSLFGVNMKREQPKVDEVWHRSVEKYSFVTAKDNEVLGQLYCDLYNRHNKLQSDCQFTIQGCRKLDDGSYQMPISTLNLCLPDNQCLSQLAVENLFHEMGHAIHSALGRTRYQNLSGTRCPTDYAEVPSNLMELFLRDERVLKSFAETSSGKPIPNEHASWFSATSNMFPAISAQTQILYSVMDQIFHSKHPPDSSALVDSFANLHRVYSAVDYVPETASFLRFAHLSTYGGKYYSYLWSRAVANLLWRKCFKRDPFSREMGTLYMCRMLSPGGGECPNVLVKNLLGYQPTVEELVQSYIEEIVELKEKLYCNRIN